MPQFSADFENGNLGHVYLVGVRDYEIHLLPDPSSHYSALWYFFKVTSLPRGDYRFTITGFYRAAPLFQFGVQPTALSVNAARRGIGWQRFGNNLNFWKSKHRSVWCLQFTFSIAEIDTLYFAYLYPYTYSELCAWISKQPSPLRPLTLCRSHGGIDVPMIFWDADAQICLNPKNLPNLPRFSRDWKKPLIVIAARHHPGESVASYAMEGFMGALFAERSRLLERFSFLLIPMMNVDGVICGYYRPSLTGYDMNRSWIAPHARRHPVEHAVCHLLDKLVKSRPLLFLLDYHGHSAQCNAFTYGVVNRRVPFNDLQGLFPSEMARQTSIFDVDGGASLAPDSYSATMRVALHHRYRIPFSYTLEMSYGGLDIGPRSGTQLTPDSYSEVGAATVAALAVVMLEQIPIHAIVESYVPPITTVLHEGND
jgi:hypothetical protein